MRVLQEGEIRPLGGNDTHKVDVRIIAATHRDLALLVRDGKFREDLYYRLAQFPIELPPLRQREGDALELARHFAERACVFLRRAPLGWSAEALELLDGYGFPGNVRELKGLVECAVLLCEGEVLLAEHFSLRAPRKRRRRSSCASIWSRSNGTCCSPACAGTLATRPSPRANWVCRDEP